MVLISILFSLIFLARLILVVLRVPFLSIAACNSVLSSSTNTSGVVNLTSIRDAQLSGSAADLANTFTLSGWTGTASLHGDLGNDVVVATNNVNFTLTDILLGRSGRGDIVLESIEVANLTGDTWF